MKVLFCAYDRPGHIATGPNAWLQRLVPDLMQTYGLQVHTLFIHSDEPENCPTLFHFKTLGLPHSSIKRDKLPYIADQVKALLSIVKHEAITVLVANLVIPAFYATRYLKAFNIPVIGVMHSNDPFYTGVIAKFIHGTPENQLKHSVAVSHYINKLSESKPTTTQLSVIPCGTPLPNQKTIWLKDTPMKVIYAGRLEVQQKQIIMLTEAFVLASTNLENTQFSIYGSGTEVEAIEAILENAKKPNQVHYKGVSAPSEMLNHFAQHHIFTLMSDYEGMPVALMEAMACGVVPVCLAETSGINEIITHGVNGFIVKDRDADYQKHLKMLLEDPDLWQNLSKNAVKTIQERYSSAKTHRQWFELLQSFSDQQIASIKIPKHIKLEGDLLYYGDNRKPSTKGIIISKVKDAWLNLRLFLRPRARLRALLNK